MKAHPRPSLHLSTGHHSVWKPVTLSDASDAQLAYAYQPRQEVQLKDLSPGNAESQVDMRCAVIWAGPVVPGKPLPASADTRYIRVPVLLVGHK